MRTHISEADFKRLMEVRNKLKPHSRIGYAGKVVEPPKLLYGIIKPNISRIEGQSALLAPKTCKEGASQYCNYGYDKTKYNSYNDCVKGEYAKCDRKPKLVGRFLVLVLFLLAIVFVFSRNSKK